MIKTILSITLFAAVVNAKCDNQCSGHGTCKTDDVCQCYDNWGMGLSKDSGDCSERICPFELAWVDNPNKAGSFHKYAECAGRGICDRSTGECQCFDGYEGKACARTSCPNDCSGHGTCEYIEDMGFASTWNDYTTDYFEDFRNGVLSSSTKKFPYKLWDRKKTRGCVCDARYGDFDCSKRLCPYGTDVLDTIDNSNYEHPHYQKQKITFKFDPNSPNVGKETFALTFRSRLNETFTTIPIVLNRDGAVGLTGNDKDFTQDVKLALLNLPNRVIDGVAVTTTSTPPPPSSDTATELTITVEFTGNAVQGPQHPLMVEDYECAVGCTPKITGLTISTIKTGATLVSTYNELQTSEYNSFECGRRGKCDYTTGLCQCFAGYIGDNCNTLTTLV